MRVLFYRDCRTMNRVRTHARAHTHALGAAARDTVSRDTLRHAINQIQIAKATAAGVVVSAAYSLETKWDYKSFVVPKAGSDTGGSW